MSCSQILSGIAKDCLVNKGGIKRVILANRDDVTAVTITDGRVTAITMASGKKFLEFGFRANTGNFSSTWQINSDNGTKYVQTLLTMIFGRMDTAKRVAIMALAQADLIGIVEDANGLFWLLGYDDPLMLADGSDAQTGTARADRNGYTVVLEDNSDELPYEVAPDIIDALIQTLA